MLEKWKAWLCPHTYKWPTFFKSILHECDSKIALEPCGLGMLVMMWSPFARSFGVLMNQGLVGDPTTVDSCGVESQVVGSCRPQSIMWSLFASRYETVKDNLCRLTPQRPFSKICRVSQTTDETPTQSCNVLFAWEVIIFSITCIGSLLIIGS